MACCLFCKGNSRACHCEKRLELKALASIRPKLKSSETLWYFAYCLLQRSAIVEELSETIKDFQESKDVRLRKSAFLLNAFLMARFAEKDVLAKPAPKEVKTVILEEVEHINLLDGRLEKIKQAVMPLEEAIALVFFGQEPERKVFPKSLPKNYGWPLNSEIVYSEITNESEKVSKELFDKDYYPRLDRRRFKSHDADGISTYTSRAKEVSREELAIDNPRDFTKTKGGIVQRRQAKPNTPKGQYLKSLGREGEKKLADFLHAEKTELKESFKGKVVRVLPEEKPKIVVIAEPKNSEIVDAYLERRKNGEEVRIQTKGVWKQRTYHTLFMERKR